METIFNKKNNVIFSSKHSAKKWDVTPEKYLPQSEQLQLIRATEGRNIIDLAKGRKTWVKIYMLIDLALFTGLRVSELADVRISDLKLSGSERTLLVRQGKGSKSRLVFIDSDLSKHIKTFLQWKKTAGEPITSEDYLLTTSDKGKSYTRHGIAKQFILARDNAKLPDRYSIHSLRHTYATYLLKQTGDLRLVQQQLGHASPSITAVYAKALPETIAKAVNGLREGLFKVSERSRTNGKSKGNSGDGNNGNSHNCRICNKKIDKPAVQLHIDGSEVEVCPVCCNKIKK
jgi:site-specific recombinase XerD